MRRRVKINVAWMMVLLGLLGLLSACGGGSSTSASSGSGGSGGSVVAATGIALPTEVSAISADTTSAAPAAHAFYRLAALASELPADSDYETTVTAKYVDEPTLEVFGIIETILKAIQQTNYADSANVAASEAEAVPYKSIVAWEEDSGGQAQKQMQEWVLKSFLTTEGDQDVNVVHVWIDEPDDQVKVECKIFQAPSQDAEGTYLNYGKWQINARFFDKSANPVGSFYADADIDADSNTVLRLSDIESRTENVNSADVVMHSTTKAVLHKTATAGYGKAIIPNYDYCRSDGGDPSPCDGLSSVTLPTYNVQYAYNQDTLALAADADHDGTLDPTIYKDRSNPVSMTYRYGLFDETTGDNVTKTKQFGFPVVVSTADGDVHGYYGAWQGRHQLWAGDSGTVADGTAVEKEVWGNEPSVSYTTQSVSGTLTKRTLVDGSLSQVQDIPMEIWLSDNFDLQYDSTLNNGAGAWKKCTWENSGNVDEFGNEIWQQSCGGAYDLSTLDLGDNVRKQVNIGAHICESYMPDTNCSDYQFSYDSSGGNFVETDFSPNPGNTYGSGQWHDGDHLWVNVGGSTYIVYDGDFTGGKTGWVEKSVQSFDEQTWTPTFVDGQDTTFDFPADHEYYINNQGANFVVRRVDTTNTAADYSVKMEVQSVVSPKNYATLLNGVAYFANEWDDPDTRSTFSFDPDTMLLNYRTVGSNDSASVGDPLSQGSWGLVAFNASNQKLTNDDDSPLQFNWEYATQDNPWGAVTYLVKDSDDQIQYLSDPISLDPLDLTTVGGDTVTFSLQFDGWMHGLPDMHSELEKNDFVINDAITDKVVNIPKGTLVTSGADSYYVKPLEVGVILPVLGSAPADAPDPTAADSLDLDFTIPDPADIGDMPTGLTAKYVEGAAAE